MTYSVGLRGESNYQAAIRATREGEAAWLIEEPDNRYDPRAIRVDNAALATIGYLPRDGWVTELILDQGIEPKAVVTAVRDGGGGDLGVVIEVTW